MSILDGIVDGSFFINLDKRTDRLKDFTEEITRMGIQSERFPAITHASGTVGCGYSHLSVLKMAKERGYKSVLIFEDDFEFIVDKSVFTNIVQKIQVEIPNYDVLMMGYALLKATPHSENFQKVLEAQTASAYLVNSKMYDELISLYEDAIPMLEKTGKHWIYANDQIWKGMQPKKEWFATCVRIGKQRPGFSDISNAFVNYHGQ
jgi:GR25 family glycosyltransferase involved in LPS biosynthesis